MSEDQKKDKLIFSRFSDEQLEKLLQCDVDYKLLTIDQILVILEILEERNPLTLEEKRQLDAMAEENWQKILASYEQLVEQSRQASDQNVASETESLQSRPRSCSPQSASFSWVWICFSDDVR